MMARIAGAVALGPRHVHVVHTPDDRLFGMRSGDRTHVLAFRERRHACSLAAALQAFHARHGRLPTCDPEDVWELGEEPPEEPPGGTRDVGVRATTVHELVRRLRGSGLVVSVLSRSPGAADKALALSWHDVRPDASRPAAEAFLAAALAPPDDAPRPGGLRPKPRWPPGASAACVLLALAAALQA